MLKTKAAFVSKKAPPHKGEFTIKAGTPVEWDEEYQFYHIKSARFFKVDPANVTGGSMQELKEIWRRLDVPGCDTLVEKGYKFIAQFEEDGEPFGAPMAFKETAHVSQFMADYPRMKMKWTHPIEDFLVTD